MVANKASSARFPGRFRLNLLGHGKPARRRAQRAVAGRRGIRGIEDHAVSRNQGRGRAPAHRLRNRRHPREWGPAGVCAASRPCERRGHHAAPEAWRLLGQGHGDIPDRRRQGAARPSGSSWSGSGRSRHSVARPTAARYSPRPSGSAKGSAASATSWLAGDGVPGIEPYYAVRHAVESVEQRPLSHP